MAEQMGVAAEFARMKGNMLRLKELWEKWDDCGPAEAFVRQLDDLINGRPLTFYPDCKSCEDNGNPNCPWYGEPDGCNNRDVRAYVLMNTRSMEDDTVCHNNRRK